MSPARLAILTLTLLLAGCSASRETAAPASSPPVVEAEVEEDAPSAAPPVVEEPAESPQLAPAISYGSAPEQWLRLDEEQDGVRGISLDRAYDALGDRKPQRAVVVAVLDSGVDITHDDFAGRIWTNTDEIADNGLDDDGNGYADDLHGWSFLGNPNGENIRHERLEITREVARLRDRFADLDPATLSGEAKADYDHYRVLEQEVQQKRAEAKQLEKQYAEMLAQTEQVEEATQQAEAILRSSLDTDTITEDDLAPGFLDSEQVQWAKRVLLYLRQNGITAEQIASERELIAELHNAAYTEVKYKYNPDYDPRHIVGDDPTDPTERYYGSNDVIGTYAAHGTSVAGIIAAVRGNDFGIDGIASDSVFIMSVRTVPSGDERDKDVANAIRYAVDNGAHIVNMSFGKDYSPNKTVVDEAVRYAAERGVLLIHAAGNDGEDLDAANNFPTPLLDDGVRASNWLEIGASSSSALDFAASFSNYGQTSVDLFAPGQEIDTLDLNNDEDRVDGTSVAAPVVSGIAALLLSYYPELTPLEVRTILLDSATPYGGTSAQRPGSGEAVDFGTLSISGGLVNALRAVELAEARAGS